MPTTVDLAGKVALVTGASSGIGAEVACELSANGATVILGGRDSQRLAAVVDRITQEGGVAHAAALDLLQHGAEAELVSRAVERGGRLDIIVNAAGVFWPKPLAETTPQDLDDQWRTNVRVPYLLTQAALPQLTEHRGAVVFFSSMLGSAGNDNCSAYCATKGAIETLTRALAVELAVSGINVNCVAPGAIETAMNEGYREDQEFYEHFRTFAPAARWGTTRDIAPVVAFLSSDAAGFMHGAIVPVDGGWVAR
jgi:NAD(P)-dependent dehydrogenase (short-subunit alcohol dehydrogenase family)